MKEIILSNGIAVKVDDIDHQRFGHLKWQSSGRGYAQRKVSIQGTRRTVYLHRAIMDAPTGVWVDHVDRDPTNSQRTNLRFATASQNNINSPPRGNTTSQYKGVTWDTHKKRWRARIRTESRRTSLGVFKNEIDAARAYDAAARKYHGDFAYLNFQEN